MATVVTDTLKDVSAVEQDGVTTALRRSCIVHGLSNNNSDAQTLNEVGAALNSAGLTVFSSPTGFSNLILTRRSPSMIDTTSASVTLEYAPIASAGVYFHWTGSSNLSSITTETDRYGVPISVTHTYNSGDIYGRGGLADTQGGEASVLSPSLQLTGTGIATSSNPVKTVDSWLNKTNSRTWFGASAGYWLCTNVQYETMVASTTPKKYRWTFSFELGATPANPKVYYIDPQTNRVPDGILSGTGSKFVSWHGARDFNTAFPTG